MITYYPGDKYWATPAHIAVNTVNCVGVMGKGLAKTFRETFPEMYVAYQGICRAGKLKPGDLHEYRYPHLQAWRPSVRIWNPTLRIWNVATKDHWKSPSSYLWVEKCINSIVVNLGALSGTHTILIPALGCGNGGLQWAEVKKMIDRQMADLQHDIRVFEPIP